MKRYGVGYAAAGHRHRNVIARDYGIEMVTTCAISQSFGQNPDPVGLRVFQVSGASVSHTYYPLGSLPYQTPIAGTATSPASTTAKPIIVSYSGASAYPALKKTELWYKRGAGGAWGNSGLWSAAAFGRFSFVSPAQGIYYFDLVAEGVAGNRSALPSANGDCYTIYDCTPPTVLITNPTAEPAWVSDSSVMSMGGTVRDNVRLAALGWRNNRGGSGTVQVGADSSMPWNVSKIVLQKGMNTITVTARDAAGYESTDQLSVDCRHALSVSASAVPGAIASGAPTQLNAQATDSWGDAIASWSWSDNGAGGAFSPSANVKNPTWKAPGSRTGTVQRTLTVTATCSGAPSRTASRSVTVTEGYQPWVTIVSPTADDTCTRTGTAMKLGCIASENTQTVRWYNAANSKQGDCTPILNSIQDFEGSVELKPGVSNEITAEAADAVGNTGLDHLVVTTIEVGPDVAAAWHGTAMISLPIIPDLPDPKLVVPFVTGSWFAFDPVARACRGYSDHGSWLEPASSTRGRGFWARFAAGARPDPCGTVPDQTQPVSIHLLPGWNLVGQPFVSQAKWDLGAIQVNVGGVRKALRDASDAVLSYAWGWDPVKAACYLVYDTSVVPSAYGYLAPWQAFWIKAIRECDLILPAP